MTGTRLAPSVQPQEGDVRTLLTGAEWILSAVGGPGVPDIVHGAQCITCAQTSVHCKDDRRSIGSWAVAHTRDNPLHQDFVKITRERWRVHPTTGPAVPVSVPEPAEVPPGRPAASTELNGDRPHGGHPRHARQQSTWRLALWAVVWGVAAWLGRGRPGVAKAGTWLWRCVAVWAGPLLLALLSAALGIFLCAAFLQGTDGRG